MSVKNGATETIDEFVTRQRKVAKRCEFTDGKLKIKLQLVFWCISKRARRKALSEEIELETLLNFDWAVELSNKLADTIEGQKPNNDHINKITRAGKYSVLSLI